MNVQNIMNRLPQPIANHFAKSKRRAIVKSALIAIEKRHPDWADVSFDEHFVAHQGMTILAGYVESGQLPDAAAIAEAWSNQFHWQSTTKQGAQERFMPVAENFVYILSSDPNHSAAISVSESASEARVMPRLQVDPARYGIAL